MRLLRLFFTFAVLTGLIGCSANHAPKPRSASTPVAPTRRAISAAVLRFYGSIVSNKPPNITLEFIEHRESRSNWGEYTTAEDITPHIDDIRGRSADVSTTYRLLSKDNTSLHFMRRETVTFVHGRGGWLADSLHVTDKILTALTLPSGRRLTITDSEYKAETGEVAFTTEGKQSWWLPNGPSGWSLHFYVATTPAPFVPDSDVPVSAATAPPETANLPRIPEGGAAPADADCEDVDVNEVYDDGAIIELLDGRKLRVSDADTATSSVWVAPFSGMICGDRFTNKDDNETVDLSN